MGLDIPIVLALINGYLPLRKSSLKNADLFLALACIPRMEYKNLTHRLLVPVKKSKVGIDQLRFQDSFALFRNKVSLKKFQLET